MDYFQARISRETACFFEMLKNKYEIESNSNFTQAAVISKAVEEVSAINDWEKIINDTTTVKIKTDIEITDKDLRIRVQISPQIKISIENYKYFFPQFVGTRSVTLGVTLHHIFKGALLIRENPSLVNPVVDDIDDIFANGEAKMLDLIAPINREIFKNIFSEMKNDVKNKQKVLK